MPKVFVLVGHLDLMPWYTKLGLTCGLALAIVAGTAAAVSQPEAWNAKTIACMILALLIAAGMAAATYYAHLHENDDQQDSPGDPAVAQLRVALLRLNCRLQEGFRT
jgi:hypothetical protein